MKKRLLCLVLAIILVAFNATSTGLASETAPNAPAVPEFVTKYYTLPGAAFAPASNSMSYTYPTNGCINNSTDSGKFVATLNMPDGTVLTSVSVGFSIQDAGLAIMPMYVNFYELNNFSVSQAIPILSSSFGGANQVQTTPLNLTIDNSTHKYTFEWLPGSGSPSGSTQSLCFIRLTYVPAPLYAVALPIIRGPAR
jgi:hypothetical protein